jgi:hypothetical protein
MKVRYSSSGDVRNVSFRLKLQVEILTPAVLPLPCWGPWGTALAGTLVEICGATSTLLSDTVSDS